MQHGQTKKLENPPHNGSAERMFLARIKTLFFGELNAVPG